MLAMNMQFNKVELRTEGKFFMESNKPGEEGKWLWATIENMKNPQYCTKEDVLTELRKPFITAQLDTPSKTLILVREEEVKIDPKKTLTSLAILGSMFRNGGKI